MARSKQLELLINRVTAKSGLCATLEMRTCESLYLPRSRAWKVLGEA